jgi:hypothetical protein
VLYREMFIDDECYRGVGIPIKLSRSRPRRPKAPVQMGADTEVVLRRLGLTPTLGSDGEKSDGSPSPAPVDEQSARCRPT